MGERGQEPGVLVHQFTSRDRYQFCDYVVNVLWAQGLLEGVCVEQFGDEIRLSVSMHDPEVYPELANIHRVQRELRDFEADGYVAMESQLGQLARAVTRWQPPLLASWEGEWRDQAWHGTRDALPCVGVILWIETPVSPWSWVDTGGNFAGHDFITEYTHVRIYAPNMAVPRYVHYC
jgi:hypothetical protein